MNAERFDPSESIASDPAVVVAQEELARLDSRITDLTAERARLDDAVREAEAEETRLIEDEMRGADVADELQRVLGRTMFVGIEHRRASKRIAAYHRQRAAAVVELRKATIAARREAARLVASEMAEHDAAIVVSLTAALAPLAEQGARFLAWRELTQDPAGDRGVPVGGHIAANRAIGQTIAKAMSAAGLGDLDERMITERRWPSAFASAAGESIVSAPSPDDSDADDDDQTIEEIVAALAAEEVQ